MKKVLRSIFLWFSFPICFLMIFGIQYLGYKVFYEMFFKTVSLKGVAEGVGGFVLAVVFGLVPMVAIFLQLIPRFRDKTEDMTNFIMVYGGLGIFGGCIGLIIAIIEPKIRRSFQGISLKSVLPVIGVILFALGLRKILDRK